MTLSPHLLTLLNGYKTFHATYFQDAPSIYSTLSQGQSPKTLVIACSDSRVDPCILFSAEPGDIFSIRNVANLVPPFQPTAQGLHGVSAALEFGVCVLEVASIIVLGHSQCAGIKHLIDVDPATDGTTFIGPWVSVAREARAVACGIKNSNECQTACEHTSIKLSLDNLMTFPWIAERVAQGKLTLQGWHFDVTSGQVVAYDPLSDDFVALVDHPTVVAK